MPTRLLQKDSGAAIVLAAGGVFVVVESWTSAGGALFKADGVSAWTLPGIYGALLVILSLLLLMKTLLSSAASTAESRLDRIAWLRIAGTLVAAIAYAMVLTKIPFFLSTAILLAALFVLYGRRRPLPIAATSLIGAGALDSLFLRLLHLPI